MASSSDCPEDAEAGDDLNSSRRENTTSYIEFLMFAVCLTTRT